MGVFEIIDGKLSLELLENSNTEKAYQSSSRVNSAQAGLSALDAKVNTFEINRKGLIPQSLTSELFELGIYSITMPVALGGLEASMLDYVKLITSLVKLDTSLSMSVIPHTGMGLGSVQKFADERQKEIILKDLVASQRILAFAMTEAHSGSDLQAMYTELKQTEENGFILSGTKSWITNGGVADKIIVCAKCPDLVDVPGASLFLYLHRDEPGLVIKELKDKMGHRGAVTSDLYFQDIKISRDRIIGTPGDGFNQFNEIVDSGRMGVAAAALGCAQKACQTFFNDRSARSKINTQLQKHAEVILFQMEAMLYLSARSYDIGVADRRSITTIAKIFCTINAWSLIKRLQFYTYGCSDNTAKTLNQLFVDVPIYQITEGPNGIIGYRAALDIMTAFSSGNETADSILPFIHNSLKKYGEKFDRLIMEVTEVVKFVRENRRPLSRNHLVLSQVLGLVTDTYVFLATLVYATAFNNENNEDTVAIVSQSSGIISEKIKREANLIRIIDYSDSLSGVGKLSVESLFG